AASSRPRRSTRASSQLAASAVGDGMLADGSRSSHSSPRTPAGPSDSTMRRSPMAGSACSDQKSAPVSNLAFCSSDSDPSRSRSTPTPPPAPPAAPPRTPLLAEPRGQPAEELAAAEDVEGDDRQGREDDAGEDGGHVDAELALEGPQRQRQGPLARALGEDQRQQEPVPDGQAVVDADVDQR